jgi:uncharacterized protein (DUF433 family)
METAVSTPARQLTANEASAITGVPLRQVHRIIDAGLLDGAVERRRNARLLARSALVGLKLAYDTADMLTLEGRRTIVGAILQHPRQLVIQAHAVTVDTRDAVQAVRAGHYQLTKARRIVTSDPATLGGAPVFKGTRIPVHDIADMLTNSDDPAAIVRAYPQLAAMKIQLGVLYVTAYPQRGRPRTKAPWRAEAPKSSETLAIDSDRSDLPSLT